MICDYYRQEFDDDETTPEELAQRHEIELAYTTDESGVHELQVSCVPAFCEFVYYVDGVEVQREKAKDTATFCAWIDGFDFDDETATCAAYVDE